MYEKLHPNSLADGHLSFYKSSNSKGNIEFSDVLTFAALFS
jgi:hypothetical protein